MTVLHAARTGSATPRAVSSAGMIRWICTGNPFYVISALLVCLGLWVSFGTQATAIDSWALLLGLAGYTLMLAGTAGLLVRFVAVWDDARTVMLLAVLMILATSVTFDVVLARDPGRGIACYLGGLAIAVIISEGMLRAVRLKLPMLFRVPYYLSLALFFLYPAAIAPLVAAPKSEALTWAMFGFSPAAALVALTLLPAIRRGRDYVQGNGSPWPWAWYPWTLFGVLGFAAAARSALLTWSMHHYLEGSSTEPYIFGFYFLAPLGLAIAVLLLEIGLVERIKRAARAGLAIPPLLVILAMIGHRHEVAYQVFLGQFMTRLGGSPLYLTLIASIAFYAYAAMRRAPHAIEAMTATIGAMAVVSQYALDLSELNPPEPLPILAGGVLLLATGLVRRNAWRCLLGACALTASALIALPVAESHATRGALAYHLILIASLVVGAAFQDVVGRALRVVGAAMAMLAALMVTFGTIDRPESIPTWAIVAYPLVMAGLLVTYGLVLGHRTSQAIAALIAACWLIALGLRGYGALRSMVAGIDYIVLGLLVFGLALLTSLAKGGVAPWRRPTAGKLPDPAS